MIKQHDENKIFKEVQYFKHHELKVARVVINYDDIKA